MVNTQYIVWFHECVAEENQEILKNIRSGPPGTRRARETVFIMKVTQKKNGKNKLVESGAKFQDYLRRYEDMYV